MRKTKYTYPKGLTSDDKRKFRAHARKAVLDHLHVYRAWLSGLREETEQTIRARSLRDARSLFAKRKRVKTDQVEAELTFR